MPSKCARCVLLYVCVVIIVVCTNFQPLKASLEEQKLSVSLRLKISKTSNITPQIFSSFCANRISYRLLTKWYLFLQYLFIFHPCIYEVARLLATLQINPSSLISCISLMVIAVYEYHVANYHKCSNKLVFFKFLDANKTTFRPGNKLPRNTSNLRNFSHR